jgi:hypothetical protein
VAAGVGDEVMRAFEECVMVLDVVVVLVLRALEECVVELDVVVVIKAVYPHWVIAADGKEARFTGEGGHTWSSAVSAPASFIAIAAVSLTPETANGGVIWLCSA